MLAICKKKAKIYQVNHIRTSFKKSRKEKNTTKLEQAGIVSISVKLAGRKG